MGRILGLLALNRHLARALVLLVSAAVALLFGFWDKQLREQQRLSLLQTEAQRTSIEVMSQTLNGNLMGSITLLGLIDGDIKQEASNGLLSQDAHVPITLSTLGNSFGAEGVFVVGEDGIIKSSWDRLNKPSTGLDVKFRPYYKMAMRGQNSVYAAVSMARGDRSLYFTAPVFTERARATSGIGAVVARTDLSQVDALISNKFDGALLLSPQGVVFASNRPEWIGFIDGNPAPERLKAIRELKQFGAMFEKSEPAVLPLHSEDGIQTVADIRYAIASSSVKWNDPSGDWKLLVIEDLGRTLPMESTAIKAGLAGVFSLLLGWMLLHLVRGRHAQDQANAQLQAYSKQQQANMDYRARLAGVSLQLQRCNSVAELAQTFLTGARDMLGAQQGVIYVQASDEEGLMQLAASNASSADVAATLEPGEGLLGQCAIEGQTRLISLVEDGFWNLRSGLGNSRPAALMIAPVVLQGRSLGVVELALINVPGPAELQQFEEMVALLAMNLEILRRHTRMPLSNHATEALEVAE